MTDTELNDRKGFTMNDIIKALVCAILLIFMIGTSFGGLHFQICRDEICHNYKFKGGN